MSFARLKCEKAAAVPLNHQITHFIKYRPTSSMSGDVSPRFYIVLRSVSGKCARYSLTFLGLFGGQVA